MPTIGERIREVRLQRGLTQSDLGDELVTASMISQIEADRARPSHTLLQAIANRLGMPVEYFMDDVDQQLTLSAHMHLTEYWLLVGNVQRALDTLQALPAPESPGRDQHHYYLLQAKAYRGQEKHADAIRLLENLREHGIRTLDKRLLFHVSKESGHVEYAMGNLMGAMHEWMSAIEYGESLLSANELPQVEIKGDLAELYNLMYKITSRQDAPEVAQQYLERGIALSAQFGELIDIANAWITDAVRALDVQDYGKSRDISERAAAIITAVTLVDQFILLRARKAAEQTNAIDPWAQAALATATAVPASFIESETAVIDDLITAGDFEVATRRTERCLDIVKDYDTSEVRKKIFPLILRRSRIAELQGDLETAIRTLEQMLVLSHTKDFPKDILPIQSQLVHLYAKSGREDALFRLSDQIQQTIEQFGPLRLL